MAHSGGLGRRCEIGCETWPDSDEFKTCPKCGEPAKRYSGMTPLTLEEARSIKAHIDFDAYYERHCARLGIPASGPLEGEAGPLPLSLQGSPPRGSSSTSAC